MKPAGGSAAGFTLVEMLVSLTVTVLAMLAVAVFLIQSVRTDKSQQMKLAVQADARNTLSMVQTALRNAGWDPLDTGLSALALDATPAGADNYIEVFADLNGDGDTADQNEDITIRHHDDRVEWKTSAASTTYAVLASGITNDADQDGTIEPMFTPDSTTNPQRIAIRITARSETPDATTGRFLTYTLVSTVVLRGRL